MYRSPVLQIQKTFTLNFRPVIHGLFVAIVSLLFSTALSAQFGRGSGGSSIDVSIYTSDGDLISVPAVVILSPEGTIGLRQTVCDDGVVTFPSLSSGDYTVTVRAPGFKDGTADVEVMGNEEADASVTLEVAPDPSTDVGAMGTFLAPKAQKELTEGLAAIPKKKYAQAQKQLDAVYQLAPGDANVNSALGELYLAQQKLPEAEHYIDRATSLGPDNPFALIEAGELRIMQHNPAAAEAPLEHVVDIQPRSKFAHWLLGITYLDLGLYEKCRNEAVTVIKINRSTATDGAYLLGQSLAALGRTAEALATLKKFVHEVPHDGYTADAKNLISKLQGQAATGSSPALATSDPAK